MTLRLIGLMSIVLFLSLSAFSLLLSHSKEAILKEVEKTVSTVGNETLHAFFTQADMMWVDGSDGAADGRFVTGPPPSPSEQAFAELSARLEEGDLANRFERTIVRFDGPSPPVRGGESDGESAGVESVAAVGEGEPTMPFGTRGKFRVMMAGGMPVRTRRPPGSDGMQVEIALVAQPYTMTSFGLPGAACVHGVACPPSHRTTAAIGSADTFGVSELETIDVETIEVETSDVDEEELVTVETAPTDPRPADPASADPTSTAATVDLIGLPEADVIRHELHEQLVFQVPTQDYDAVFSAIQQRVLYLFLGVLLLGTVLSAGLARRFTRPIRELDQGLRRLSGGDLDTEVTVPRQDDEVSRLGHLFNRMTGQLRKSRARERDLTRREKMSALGRLAAGVAHDVRNPLHSINLTLQHLEETCRPAEAHASEKEFDRSVDLIRGEIKRLDGLVANFLKFARNDRADSLPVLLSDLVHETARLLAKEAERKGIVIRVDVEDEGASLEASPEALRSALLNLALNSLEAMEDGGVLTLRVTANEEANEVGLEVIDDGAGIDDEERERVFEFGYSTRDQGHGLGLAMVHQIVVEEHGGRVVLESEPGIGTRVALTLPRAARRREEQA